MDIRDMALNHVSPNKQELIRGAAMFRGLKVRQRWTPYDARAAAHKRNVCEALVPLKMPFLLSPREYNRGYFGKPFKFASTTDLANFLKGIGPIARGMLRNITVCAYHTTSAERACKLLADATNLETLHFTAICVAEAGCRRNHKRYPPMSYDGKEFALDFREAMYGTPRYYHSCLKDILCQKPILRFDPEIARYDADFDAYTQEQPLSGLSMLEANAAAFRNIWAQVGIPLQE